jgi:hypothetical protein
MCMWLSAYVIYVGNLVVWNVVIQCIGNLKCGSCGSLIVGTLECWYVSMLYVMCWLGLLECGM